MKLHWPRWPFILRSTHERRYDALLRCYDKIYREMRAARNELAIARHAAEVEQNNAADLRIERDAAWSRVKELEAANKELHSRCDAATQPTTTQADALTQVFAATSKFISTDLAGQLDQHVALCKQYGLDLVMYEGGQSLMPVNKTTFAATDLMYQAQLDPRMGQMYDQLFAMCHSKGVVLFENFSLVGPWDKYGFWCAAQTLTDTAGPRWQCLLRESAKSN